MSLNKKKKNKTYRTLKFQIGVVVFALLFIVTLITIILFHTVITSRSLDSVIVDSSYQTSQKIISIAKKQLDENFWNSLTWVFIALALTDVVIAYGVSFWISKPIEDLLILLNVAHKNGVPYAGLNDEKFSEINNISDIVEDMTNKYVSIVDDQNKFIQDISHELKTPLTAIKSTGDLIKMDHNAGFEDYKQYFHTTDLMNQKLIYLVNQLLLSNKTEAELYDNQIINLSEIVKDIVQKFNTAALQKNITLNLQNEKITKIYGNSRYISTAISNIVENSIKYMPENAKSKTINIVLERRLTNIILSIKDNGGGIAESELKNVLGRFYRGENVDEVAGNGLGLYISKKIVNAHSGKFIIKSQMGEGTEIRIIFNRIK